jgi:hypothetical protein
MGDFYEYANKKISNCVEHFYTRYIKQVRYHSYITKCKWIEVMAKVISNPITLPRYVSSL